RSKRDWSSDVCSSDLGGFLSTGPVRGSRRIRGDEEAPRRHDQDRAASALLVGWALVARALVERSRASAEVGCVGLDESSELGQLDRKSGVQGAGGCVA